MAGGGGPPVPEGSGGKKSVDFQLNLIPFIDLLSAMISFLLITAVWTQVARIDVRQQATESEPQDEPQEEPLGFKVLIKGSGYTVFKKGAEVAQIAKKADAYDIEALTKEIEKIKGEHPDNADVTVTSEDSIPYSELIQVMDACLQFEIDGITVAGVSA